MALSGFFGTKMKHSRYAASAPFGRSHSSADACAVRPGKLSPASVPIAMVLRDSPRLSPYAERTEVARTGRLPGPCWRASPHFRSLGNGSPRPRSALLTTDMQVTDSFVNPIVTGRALMLQIGRAHV